MLNYTALTEKFDGLDLKEIDRNQNEYFYAPKPAKIEVPTKFAAVMKFWRFQKRGHLYFWLDVMSGLIYPMRDDHMALVVANCNFERVGIIDGAWELTGEKVLSLKPVLDKPRKRKVS